MASDDVLDREQVASHIGTLSNKDLWTGADEEAAEALEVHDNVLRDRVAELEGLVRTLLGPHRPGGEATNASLDNTSTYELYATGSTIRRARRALDKGEDNGQ